MHEALRIQRKPTTSREPTPQPAPHRNAARRRAPLRLRSDSPQRSRSRRARTRKPSGSAATMLPTRSRRPGRRGSAIRRSEGSSASPWKNGLERDPEDVRSGSACKAIIPSSARPDPMRVTCPTKSWTRRSMASCKSFGEALRIGTLDPRSLRRTDSSRPMAGAAYPNSQVQSCHGSRHALDRPMSRRQPSAAPACRSDRRRPRRGCASRRRSPRCHRAR